MARNKISKPKKKEVDIPKQRSRFTGLLQNASRIPPFLVALITLWIFAAFIYGPVFYICEQSSYFAFDPVLMQNITCTTTGSITLVGRFFLLSFRYPIIGGLVFALILTIILQLSCYLCGQKKILYAIPIVLVYGFLFFLLFSGYNIFYQREPSLFLSIPLIALIVIALLAIAKRLVTKNDIFSMLRPVSVIPQKDSGMLGIVVFVLGIAVSGYAWTANENIRTACRLQHLLEDDNYEKMIEVAQSASQPNRSVAAYHAIALLQTGQLLDHMFDIPYQFQPETIKNKANLNDDATTIYTIDGDFFAGLTMTSYHQAMERMVIDGPSVFMIKRLCRAALANREWNLVRKYLFILEKNPFESKTVERYRALMHSPERIASDPTFMNIERLKPVHDSFEQGYRAPLFLGYNVMAEGFRTFDALKNSLAACLYTKMMPNMLDRAQLMAGQPLPIYLEQAIGLQSFTYKELRQIYSLERGLGLNIIRKFAKSAAPYLNKREEGAKVLRKEWLKSYPYYYYFENLPNKKKIEYHQLKKEGVN